MNFRRTRKNRRSSQQSSAASTTKCRMEKESFANCKSSLEKRVWLPTMLRTKSTRRNTEWKGIRRSRKKSHRRMNFCSRNKNANSAATPCCTRLVWRSQDKKSVGNTHKCNQVQQSTPKQQQLGQDVDATLLASGSAERSGIKSLVLSTLSRSSSMEHAGCIQPTQPRQF